jgi:hypothetical protein
LRTTAAATAAISAAETIRRTGTDTVISNSTA